MTTRPPKLSVRCPKGMIVRRPDYPYKPLEQGEVTEVPDNSYWRRRIKFGDVELNDRRPPKAARRSSTTDKE